MSEYKCKEGMIDNRMVKEDHQQGIMRVMQRKQDRNNVAGHYGKMGMGDKAHWSRKGDPLTPRKA
jgi:hypothetical protein